MKGNSQHFKNIFVNNKGNANFIKGLQGKCPNPDKLSTTQIFCANRAETLF